MLDPELLERITARRAELDKLEEQLAKQLAEVRAERDELAVAERVLERMSEQLADERASVAPVPGHVGGRAVMLIPHCTSGVEETTLPPDYQRILAAVRQAAGPVMARQVGDALARWWWQYAAGAGDDPAGYLLYLYHLSRGEDQVADWWLDQTGIDPTAQEDARLVDDGLQNADTLTVGTDIATILRILTRLVDPEAPSRRTEMVCTVMDYVASAVATGNATNPEWAQIPLPTDFAEHLELVMASTRAASRRAGRTRVLFRDWFKPGTEQFGTR